VNGPLTCHPGLAALLIGALGCFVTTSCADTNSATDDISAADAGSTADQQSDTAAAQGPSCTIGTVVDGSFVAWQADADAELVLGYQGYLFVHVQVLDASGTLRKPKARMTAECAGQQPSVTSRWRADMTEQGDGSTVSELIEVWLFPALLDEFEGHTGRVQVELEQDEQTCTAAVDVRYVDDELCKHREDGTIKCVK